VSPLTSGDEPLSNPIAGSRCAHATSSKVAASLESDEAASLHARCQNQVLRDPRRLALCDRQPDRRPSWIDASKGRVFRSGCVQEYSHGLGSLIWVGCPAPVAKIFRFPFDPNQLHMFGRLVPLEGRLAIVTDAGRDAVDAACQQTNAIARGRQSRVVLTPQRWRQVGESNFTGDGGKKARSPGRARRKPLKPLRGECRVFPA
jgi:hypothetical protein